MTVTELKASPSRAVAAEVRAAMARQNVSQTDLAARLGTNQAWISRRLGRGATYDLTLEEVLEMAKALGVSAEGLLEPYLYAIRDSNPEPADLEQLDRPTCHECGGFMAWSATLDCWVCDWCGIAASAVNLGLTADPFLRSSWVLGA